MEDLLSLFDFTAPILKRYYRSKYRKEYYKQLETEEDAYSLLQLLQPKAVSKLTPELIRYNGIAFGSGAGLLRKKLGTPRFSFSIPMHTTRHLALVFVKKINGHNIIINCHFLDGQFFLVHNHIEDPAKDLCDFLKLEMENKFSCTLNEKENLLIDSNGNRFYFSTLPNVHSYMFSGERAFRDKLADELYYQQNKTAQQRIKCFHQIAHALA